MTVSVCKSEVGRASERRISVSLEFERERKAEEERLTSAKGCCGCTGLLLSLATISECCTTVFWTICSALVFSATKATARGGREPSSPACSWGAAPR